MSNLITIAVLFVISLLETSAQNKQDYQWVIGHDPDFNIETGIQGLVLDFNNTNIVREREGGLSFDNYCSSICDENGNLLFYTNGCAIANARNKIMLHGDSLNRGGGFFETAWRNDCIYGYPGRQNIITLPDPGNPNGYYVLHIIIDKIGGEPSRTERLLYTYVDMTLDGGLGDVTKSNNVVLDTMSLMPSYTTAITHSNGHDWWVLLPKDNDNVYLRLLIDSKGIHEMPPQKVDEILKWSSEKLGFSRFSPDGSKYVFFNVKDQLHLYDFDRSTGLLSNVQAINTFEEGTSFAGIEWSPNGRFVYVSNGDGLYQVDTHSSNIVENGIRFIATWDGTLNPFPNKINEMVLGPDCKIYVRPTSDTYSWHIIYRPDELGTDCRFKQNAIHFPRPTGNGTIPNFPRFRVDDPDPCDPTITSVFGLPVSYTRDLVTYPNPVRDVLTIELPEEDKSGQLILRDMQGRVWHDSFVDQTDPFLQMDVSQFPSGVYQASFWSEDKKYVYVNGVSVVR